MRAEDSSSASANLSFAITAAKAASGGAVRVALERLDSPSACEWLYLRKEYLFSPNGRDVPPFASLLFEGVAVFPILLKNKEALSLLSAARTFEAERAAMKYLSRAEHSRFQLERKLRKKGFSAKEAAPALDFLAASKILDDRRFALAWLNSRVSLHPEGKAALFAELSERGVSREDSGVAIAAFFESHDEEDLCRRAAEKLIRRGRTGEKLAASLLSRGFPLNMALRVAGEAPA